MVDYRRDGVQRYKDAKARGASAAELAEIARRIAEARRPRDPFGNPRPIARMPMVALPVCVHRGGIIKGDPVKVACTGCGGSKSTVAHHAYQCAIHGRCLPYFCGPWGEAQREVEAKIYRLCESRTDGRCPDYEERGP